ncbi:Gfo/Idh/MocA family protein [Rhodopirellula bahusiensis]|uniref:Oxidoreductase n=1 Tax=Rhodopirellula bahusiensis TaxID=2014065 RepID=A0A2G1W109_9BACT|nr:Gfo/Idh/MocA family oxidoreductase [Rhodopirellula bahusiensis]PHQ32706.1 oxidoreductase [Rhodopirellula bahusiensis]
MPKRTSARNENAPSSQTDGGQDAVSEQSVVMNQRASRRTFIQSGGIMLAGGSVLGTNLSVARGAHAYGDDTLKIGLIGCGSRGTNAVIQAMNTDGATRLVAMADVFESNVQSSYRAIKSKHGKSDSHGQRVDVEGARFIGLDGWKHVLQSDADIVFLTTPPGFRPLHFEKAVEAGKHVFMEKPVATDAPGVRRVLAANEIAQQKGLAVAVGLQRHHEARYRECIEQLHEGAIGDPIFARAYWNGAGSKLRPRPNNVSELEYQLRQWQHFNWIGGDHIAEQHVHNLDVINWLLGEHPATAQGQGGRDTRSDQTLGETFDHHMVEFTYSNDVRLLSQCRHVRGCWNSVSEHVHGTKGSCDVSAAIIRDTTGKIVWQSSQKNSKDKGCQQAQNDLFASLRNGEIPNEGDYGATSTMTAIMGRMASYSGKIVRWNEALQSEQWLADVDAMHSLRDIAPVQPLPNGNYEVAIPGQTKVI